MERITFRNIQGLKIRGVLQKGTNDKLIIMCHGFRSNRSSHGRFDRFAECFQNLGYNVMRFDFGGCGESENRPLSLEDEVNDLIAAMNHAVSKGFTQIALYGQSLGARVCLESYQPNYIKTMILTGAGTGPVTYDWTEEFTSAQLKELKETGYLKQPVQDPYRKEIVISKQMLVDFEQLDQEKLLSSIQCPVLIVHGDQGEEEILLPLTEKGMKWLPPSSQLTVIKGAPHSFEGYLNHVEKTSIDWLHKHF
ncbi:alpha/beta hydrolase [Halobacillus sp. HZG1]|uniref:alpha/beta hydrolase family protein n=1 Tax=Halobacillus sp. HZG1 TaxID=3111769 RepID=UPI002DBA244D|nr:alpha/beta hydrolase [Halobacillus sp. HZG1]MEC3884478.1 alpha/beta hydrolase [Halobacillus sp. HZG1]